MITIYKRIEKEVFRNSKPDDQPIAIIVGGQPGCGKGGVISYTQNVTYNLTMSKKFINKDDKVLIIDDFLATGEACNATIKLINQAGAEVVGIGILIEKTFQSGITKLEEQGIDVYSLARVKSLKNGKIEFMD